MMRRLIPLISLCTLTALASPTLAEDHEPGEYGRLLIGPKVGPVLGISGPRAGYLVSLELTYRTPRFFYYNFEVGFLHLLPRTITVGATTDGDAVIAPEHEVDVTGLYGIPATLEVGMYLPLGRVRLRIGVGFGAMISFQTVRSFENDLSEMIMGFCFRPGIGVDVAMSSGGLLRFDFAYLWQDANFEITGNDRDVDSLLLTVGYSWLLME